MRHTRASPSKGQADAGAEVRATPEVSTHMRYCMRGHPRQLATDEYIVSAARARQTVLRNKHISTRAMKSLKTESDETGRPIAPWKAKYVVLTKVAKGKRRKQTRPVLLSQSTGS